MYDSSSRGISYTAGFFMLVAFGLAGLILAGALSIPIWTATTGRSFTEMQTEMNNPQYADTFRLIQVISVVLGLFLPTLFTALLMNKKPLRLLGFQQRVTWQQAGLVVAIMFLSLFVSASLASFTEIIPIPEGAKARFKKLEDAYNDQVQIMTGMKTIADYLLAIFIMAFLPALCEETLFRGGLQNFLDKATRKPVFALIIVSILFSLVHLSYYGFLSRMFLGVILGMVFLFTGSIWLCIIGHFFNNALAVTQLYIYTKQGKDIQAAIEEQPAFYWGLLALPLLIFLLIRLKKISDYQPLYDRPAEKNPFD